jgi:hypothetical protein
MLDSNRTTFLSSAQLALEFEVIGQILEQGCDIPKEGK